MHRNSMYETTLRVHLLYSRIHLLGCTRKSITSEQRERNVHGHHFIYCRSAIYVWDRDTPLSPNKFCAWDLPPIFASCLWTRSIFPMSFCRWGLQICTQYSRCSVTRSLYSGITIFFILLVIALSLQTSIRLALSIVWPHYWFDSL